MKLIESMLSRHNVENELFNESWVQNEAAKPVNVNKTGTLRLGCSTLYLKEVLNFISHVHLKIFSIFSNLYQHYSILIIPYMSRIVNTFISKLTEIIFK